MSETKPARKGKKRALTLRYKLFITLFLVCLATLLLDEEVCRQMLDAPTPTAFCSLIARHVEPVSYTHLTLPTTERV